jgi:muramoyltetrapeptide carboxypeptidase
VIKKWSYLKPGDIVDIIAPGFAPDPKVVKKSCEILRSWRLVPRVSKNLIEKDLLCANLDSERLRQLVRALNAPDSKAIWCMRGGYGCLRLLPGLEKIKIKSRPKLLLGLSDITVLQSYLNEQMSWVSLHGPNFDRLGMNRIKPRFARELKALLFGEQQKMAIANQLRPLNKLAKRSSMKVAGILKGGNLVTVQGLLGTAAELSAAGSILFFEDIGERGYRVDRVLEQFSQMGLFNKARAVVFGDFTEGKESNGREKVTSVLERFAKSVQIPVLSGFPCGHGEIQRPVFLGSRAVIRLGKKPDIVYSSGGAPD